MKTTNLTFLEAIEAMQRGECVKGDGWIYSLRDGFVCLWTDPGWGRSGEFGVRSAPFCIVPDPSKPEQKESERIRNAWERAYPEHFSDTSNPTERYYPPSRNFYSRLTDYILARVREEQGK